MMNQIVNRNDQLNCQSISLLLAQTDALHCSSIAIQLNRPSVRRIVSDSAVRIRQFEPRCSLPRRGRLILISAWRQNEMTQYSSERNTRRRRIENCLVKKIAKTKRPIYYWWRRNRKEKKRRCSIECGAKRKRCNLNLIKDGWMDGWRHVIVGTNTRLNMADGRGGPKMMK